jgi:beta-lactamase regulating signal transducer with metallopeptidase domain
MTPLTHALSPILVDRICNALIQFGWQGAVAAVLLGLALYSMRNSPAQSRYAACCVALLLMALCPVLTVCLAQPARAPVVVAASKAAAGKAAGSGEIALPVAGGVAADGPIRSPQADTAASGGAHLLLVSAWLLGVLVLSVRLIGGSLIAARLTRRGVLPMAADQDRRFRELAARMGIRLPVRLFQSPRVRVPVVVGCIRCVVLLPIAAATGLSSDQLQALLAHELAHVRRHDYLVNIAQSIVETLLFYHPAVWWVSGRMRREREICCDDLAVRSLPDRTTYAHALARVEELREKEGLLALAAGGGDLRGRIRHVLGLADPAGAAIPLPGLIPIGIAAAALFVLTLRAGPAVSAQPRPSGDDNVTVARSAMKTIDGLDQSWSIVQYRLMNPLSEKEWVRLIGTMRELRERWRAWADDHKELLRRLAAARPEDEALMREVWDAVPAHLMSAARTGTGVRDLIRGPGWAIVWEGWDKTQRRLDPKAGARASDLDRRIGEGIAKRMFADFRTHRDVVVAWSAATPVHFTLWASGRITEEWYAPPPAKLQPGAQRDERDDEYKTIDPPFSP